MALKVIGFLGMCALLAVPVFGKIWAIAPVPIITALLLLLGHRFDYWLFKRRYKRMPDYGFVAKLSFTESGILAVTSKINVSINLNVLI